MTGSQRFDQLALPHLGAAYSLAVWLVRDRADAEDVVQDAYLRAFKSFDQFSGADIKPWLLTIVRNVAYRWLAVRKRMANVVSIEDAMAARDDRNVVEPASAEPSAEEILIGQDDGALVREALAQLPPNHREIVVLRDLEGLSYRDIATVVGIPIGTVMSRLARARDQLKVQLAATIDKENKDAL